MVLSYRMPFEPFQSISLFRRCPWQCCLVQLGPLVNLSVTSRITYKWDEPWRYRRYKSNGVCICSIRLLFPEIFQEGGARPLLNEGADSRTAGYKKEPFAKSGTFWQEIRHVPFSWDIRDHRHISRMEESNLVNVVISTLLNERYVGFS